MTAVSAALALLIRDPPVGKFVNQRKVHAPQASSSNKACHARAIPFLKDWQLQCTCEEVQACLHGAHAGFVLYLHFIMMGDVWEMGDVLCSTKP